jgi:protein-disulfide isomerase
MGNNIIKIILLSCAFLVISKPAPSLAADDGATQEILKQLSEMRRDINALRTEVSELRKTVAEKLAGAGTNGRKARVAAKTVDLDDDPAIGAADAKVAIIEFTDYQCPFCKRYHVQTFPQIKRKYIDTGKVRYVVRDFPLRMHAQAKTAAIAANCAGAQGAYWKMNNDLFGQQGRLGAGLYDELAKAHKLDVTAFDNCMKSTAQVDEIDKDALDGRNAGITGTPSFFIGRIEKGKVTDAKLITGAKSFTVFARTIDPLLATAQRK